MTDLEKSIAEINISLEEMDDPKIEALISRLLNIIESQAMVIKKQSDDIQILRDENNRLKGGPGKPNIRKQTKPNRDISSEKERKAANNTKCVRAKKERAN